MFFNYFYWMINIGALLSYLGIAQLATNGAPALGVPKRDGFFASFCICSLCIVVAMSVFVGSAHKFIMVPPKGSAFADFTRTFYASAVMTREGRLVLLGVALEVVGFLLSTVSAFLDGGSTGRLGDYFAVCGGGACVLGLLLIAGYCCDCEWVGRGNLRALLLQEGRGAAPTLTAAEAASVADVKQLLRILPALCCSVPFWVGYQQGSGAFYAQTCQFDIRLGGTQLNGALLNSFDCIAIIVCIPIFDNCLYPLIEKAKGSKFTSLQQMGTGLALMAVTMLLAAALELWRKSKPLLGGGGPGDDEILSNCAPAGVVMSDVSTWWMSFPYFLIGVGECFVSIPLFDVCYSEVVCSHRQSICCLLPLTWETTCLSCTLLPSYQPC